MCDYCKNDKQLTIITSEVNVINCSIDDYEIDLTLMADDGDDYLIRIQAFFCPMCGEKL